MEMEQSIPTRALSRARGLSMRTHLTAVEPTQGLAKISYFYTPKWSPRSRLSINTSICAAIRE